MKTKDDTKTKIVKTRRKTKDEEENERRRERRVTRNEGSSSSRKEDRRSGDTVVSQIMDQDITNNITKERNIKINVLTNAIC